MSKMTAERTGVIQKYWYAFNRFSSGLRSQTKDIYINKRLIQGTVKGECTKIKPVRIVKIGDP